MKVSYRRDREHNYIVAEAPAGVSAEEYRVRMLTANEIPGLLPCRMGMVDGRMEFSYEVTALRPASGLFEQRAVGHGDIRTLVCGLHRALKGMERYLLDEDGLLLEPEHIYLDEKEMYFCYLPFGGRNLAESFRQLAEYLLKRLDHRDEQAVIWGYRLYMEADRENCSPGAVVQELQEVIGQWEELQEIQKRDGSRQEKEDPGRAEADMDSSQEERREEGQKTEDYQGCGSLQRRRQPETGEEHLRKKRKRTRLLLILMAIFVVAGVLAALVLSGILTLTQAGGILFLIGGVLFYLKPGESKTADDRRSGREGPGRSEGSGRPEGSKRPEESKRTEGSKRPEGSGRSKKKSRLVKFWKTPERQKTKETGNTAGNVTENTAEYAPGNVAKNATENAAKRKSSKRNSPVKRERLAPSEKPEDIYTFCEEMESGEESKPEGEKASGKEALCQRTEELPGSEKRIGPETELLQEEYPQKIPILLRKDSPSGEKVQIDRQIFRIGKQKNRSDLVLHSSVVSRVHAEIRSREDGWYLKDLHSTNGTWLNGERLQGDECKKLGNGDEICFACVQYIFRE